MSYDETQDEQPTEQQDAGGEQPADDASMEFDPAYVSGGKKPVNKPAMLLGGLAVLGAIGIWFTYFHKAPESATAGSDDNRFNEVASFDAGKIELMKQTIKDTEKVVQQFRLYPGRTQVPLASLHGNPFRELVPKGDSPKPVANTDKDEELRHKKITLAVADLKLQSVIRGKRPGCMINNVFYRQGDTIADLLTIEEIKSGVVIVRGEKWRFELQIQK
jgi:hypothetical protein